MQRWRNQTRGSRGWRIIWGFGTRSVIGVITAIHRLEQMDLLVLAMEISTPVVGNRWHFFNEGMFMFVLHHMRRIFTLGLKTMSLRRPSPRSPRPQPPSPVSLIRRLVAPSHRSDRLETQDVDLSLFLRPYPLFVAATTTTSSLAAHSDNDDDDVSLQPPGHLFGCSDGQCQRAPRPRHPAAPPYPPQVHSSTSLGMAGSWLAQGAFIFIDWRRRGHIRVDMSSLHPSLRTASLKTPEAGG